VNVFTIAGADVAPASRAELELRPAQLPSGGFLSMPLVVLHGSEPGPVLWLTAALHGDEVAGVDIIRRVLGATDPASLRGTVLACPVVNVPGFASGDRYFPDRRDLNRSFPGSPRGSLTSRFAHVLLSEVIARGDVGIDLHTGSDHRNNLPQVRADLDDPATRRLATVFGAPVAMHARTRDGSLREAAVRRGVTTLLFEGGQPWRFDEQPIEVGARGIRSVMSHLGMVESVPASTPPPPTRFLRKSRWVRAPRSGVARVIAGLGDTVEARAPVAVVADAYGSTEQIVRAPSRSLVIGRLEHPVVHRGDALVHLAALDDSPTPLDPTDVSTES
jgi:predicted deacylase